MITASDSFFTYDLGKYYVILPQTPIWNVNDFASHFNAEQVPEGFSYNSNNNANWESVESIRALIKEHVDPTFQV